MNFQNLLKKQNQQLGEIQIGFDTEVQNSNQANDVSNALEAKISNMQINKELLGSKESFSIQSESSIKSQLDTTDQQKQENILDNQYNNLALIQQDSDNKQIIVNQNQEDEENQEQVSLDKQKQERSLSIQINHSISEMKNYSSQFIKEYKYISQIQQYQPNIIEENKKDQYTISVTNFNKLLHQFQCWPHLIRGLQHSFEILSKKFVRLQVQIAQRIEDHFKITYTLKDEDLGCLLKNNKNLCDELEQLKQQFLNEKSIQESSINECISNLTQQFNDIYGTALTENQREDILKAKSELNNLYLERDQKLMELTQNFQQTVCNFNLLSNEEQFKNLEIQEIIKEISKLNRQEQKILTDAQCSYEEFKQRRDEKIKDISLQIQGYQKQIQDLQTEKEKKEENNLKKLEKDLNQIKVCHSTIQKIFMQSNKDCFHYIILLDQSSSFQNAYQSAKNGILQFTKNLQQNDVLTIVSFASSSRIIVQKQKVSQINLNSLEANLRNMLCGGTCFISAFESLKQIIQNQLNTNEYPIILFVTDGQDSSNLSNTILDVRNQVEDLIFFTVGYGYQINQKQLHLITNLFNRTDNLTKNINNNKTIKLYYENQTPDKLQQDIIKISQNKLSIEEIQEAADFLEKSFNKQNQLSEDYYTSKIQGLEKRIQECVNQEKQLMDNQKNIQHFRDQSKQQLEQIQQQIQSLKNQKFAHENRIQKIKSEKLALDKNFQNKIISNQTNLQSNMKQENYEALYEYQIKQINQEADSLIKKTEDKMQAIRKEEDMSVEKNRKRIIELGFQNIQQFYKFRELYENIGSIQQSASNIKQKYIIMLDAMIDIGQMLEQNINCSKKNIENMNKNDTENRILQYFQKFDKDICLQDKSEAKRKVLLIQNSSIYNICQQQKKESLYENCINNLEFSDLFKLVDQDEKSQEKYIIKEIVPNIIKQPKQQISNQLQIQKYNTKINEIKMKIEEQTDNNKIQLLTQTLEQYEEQLDLLKDKEQDLIADYQDRNYDDIKIVKQITYSFIEAIKCASIELKYQFAVLPYRHYMNNIYNCYYTLKIYENPKLLDNYVQSETFETKQRQLENNPK
ncbi:von willebrand factor type A domain protein (macronuclear) [Tetrahymena thermophila SB210]|uniref:von willebrand factor type A domain protein n=1 Tax=Tetrahymena thermophila (strain SB210) TaxID=312017 RepID=I7M1Q8_TETTS|nr:von willebrand factor type A domain protein [Tetrahymena thermophila SB210]EAR97367.1 von willebrand factor type A domain protein [Tetrahymena thermophila SB210]|eukprot:XP_001017612.1 von willebrand factor type A domain protein [Tetrahymena thermophila SB210]